MDLEFNLTTTDVRNVGRWCRRVYRQTRTIIIVVILVCCGIKMQESAPLLPWLGW